MKRLYNYLVATALLVSSFNVFAQRRYINEVFTDAEIEVTSEVTYATNIDFLHSTRLSSSSSTRIGTELTVIKTALGMGQNVPGPYFDLSDTSTVIKLQNIKMDVYAPTSSADTVQNRPVIIFLHTGNFLPAPINGSPLGTKTDSSAIVLCQGWAKRGYVAISADYRLGWNPLALTEIERRASLLNAVYRSIQDLKQCVSNLRVDASGANTYRIDPAKIVIYGEGTGAYIANAYSTLDKYPEMALEKFTIPGLGVSMVDTAKFGRLDGSGIPQSLTIYPPAKASTIIQATVAAGGALADTSWLEAGDAPMIALQCIRDPFAPFHEGTVVVPTDKSTVVEVQGANLYIQRAVELGNNDAIKSMPNDIYTIAAREKYGKTFDYIYPNQTTLTVNTGLEGLFAVDLPKASGTSVFENQAAPWQWWDPNSPLAKYEVATGLTAHMASLQSNPDMSPAKGRAYVDTIHGYVNPRLSVILGFYTTTQLGVAPNSIIRSAIYPNPSNGTLYIDSEKELIRSVHVFDMNGSIVSEVNNVNSISTTLNLSSVENGCYFIQLNTDQGTAMHKMALTK
ncbi:MAG: T9SS type A sorting domain-containing protein [Flavobacteriales bacterium]|nr:T9SS type A sorting domain-containing protein [Flavobacteriales bacterium]